jgi:hypothetical protein
MAAQGREWVASNIFKLGMAESRLLAAWEADRQTKR